MTLDKDSPREWYYALFDYGAMLKRKKMDLETGKRRKQGTFKGSDRELRGSIIRALLENGEITKGQLFSRLPYDEHRLHRIVIELSKEGLIDSTGDVIRIS